MGPFQLPPKQINWCWVRIMTRSGRQCAGCAQSSGPTCSPSAIFPPALGWPASLTAEENVGLILYRFLHEVIHQAMLQKRNTYNMCMYIYIPVVPARGGAEVALKIYIRPFSSIELACAARQPSPCVRALCESGVLFHMSHLKLHFALRTSHCSLHTPRCTLHTPPFTLHSSHCTLRSQHFTSHCTLKTPHFTLHTSHSTLHTSHCTLRTPNFTLHTSHFSLLPSHSKLHTSHFTLHSSHPTLHLIWALRTLSQLSSSHLISSHMSSKLSWMTSQYY